MCPVAQRTATLSIAAGARVDTSRWMMASCRCAAQPQGHSAHERLIAARADAIIACGGGGAEVADKAE